MVYSVHLIIYRVHYQRRHYIFKNIESALTLYIVQSTLYDIHCTVICTENLLYIYLGFIYFLYIYFQ